MSQIANSIYFDAVCPKCHAPKGKPCVMKGGKKATEMHLPRYRAYDSLRVSRDD